eukprot:365664-Chlamydomonas_euryale.AAC.7
MLGSAVCVHLDALHHGLHVPVTPACSGEKKVLKAINARTGPGALRYFLPDASDASRRKPLVSTDAEKVYLLLGDALSDGPAEGVDFSLKQEADHVLRVSQRIASCMVRCVQHADFCPKMVVHAQSTRRLGESMNSSRRSFSTSDGCIDSE